MRRAIISALLALFAAPVVGQEVTVDIENFTVGAMAELVLKVTNTGTTFVKAAFIDCAFLNADGRALDIGRALVSNLAPGDIAYDKAAIASGAGVEKATCRASQVR